MKHQELLVRQLNELAQRASTATTGVEIAKVYAATKSIHDAFDTLDEEIDERILEKAAKAYRQLCAVLSRNITNCQETSPLIDWIHDDMATQKNAAITTTLDIPHGA